VRLDLRAAGLGEDGEPVEACAHIRERRFTGAMPRAGACQFEEPPGIFVQGHGSFKGAVGA
jgi:hypothetical protein